MFRIVEFKRQLLQFTRGRHTTLYFVCVIYISRALRPKLTSRVKSLFLKLAYRQHVVYEPLCGSSERLAMQLSEPILGGSAR